MQIYHELVSARPYYEVLFSELLLYSCGKVFQDAVSGFVAAGIVYLLKIVYVKDCDAADKFFLSCFAESLREYGIKRIPVVCPCERVPYSSFSQLVLSLLFIRNIVYEYVGSSYCISFTARCYMDAKPALSSPYAFIGYVKGHLHASVHAGPEVF